MYLYILILVPTYTYTLPITAARVSIFVKAFNFFLLQHLSFMDWLLLSHYGPAQYEYG